ncbi:hypothetical protein ABPG74_002136 [Tetrahymena malaccensis]
MRKLTILVLLALICIAQAGNFRFAQSSGISTQYQFNSVDLSQCDPTQGPCPCDPSDPSCSCWYCFPVSDQIFCYWICDQ